MDGLRLINIEETRKFYDTDLFRERNKPVGNDTDDDVLAKALSYDLFLGYYVNGKLVSVTACMYINKLTIEVHTLFLTEYRNISIKVLKEQIDFFNKVGIQSLITCCPIEHKSVRNFLIKRLGFKEKSFTNGLYKLELILGGIYE